jgi:outer membrane protein
MRNSLAALITLLAFALTTSAFGANLTEIYNLALENDPQLKQAEAVFEAAKEAENQVGANFKPQLGAGASLSKTEFDDGDRTVADVSLALNQNLYNETYNVQRRLAKSTIAQADVEFQANRQALALRVADAYFGVLAAEDTLAFARSEKESVGRQLEQTKQRFEVGLLAITDVHESQARYDLIVAQEIEAENQLNAARETLRTITGQYHEDLAMLIENTPLLTPEPADINAWTNSALNQNLAILAAQQEAEQARENINLARAPRYPTVGAFLNYEHANTDVNGIASSNLDGNATTLGVQLDWTLYDGGRINANVNAARQNEIAAIQGLETIKRDAQLQVRNAYLGVLSGIGRVNALKQAVISSQSALQATEAGYEVGTRTTVDVLDARSALFGAQRDYAQARYTYILNTLRLKQAASQLTVNDLSQINTWLK